MAKALWGHPLLVLCVLHGAVIQCPFAVCAIMPKRHTAEVLGRMGSGCRQQPGRSWGHGPIPLAGAAWEGFMAPGCVQAEMGESWEAGISQLLTPVSVILTPPTIFSCLSWRFGTRCPHGAGGLCAGVAASRCVLWCQGTPCTVSPANASQCFLGCLGLMAGLSACRGCILLLQCCCIPAVPAGWRPCWELCK